MYNILKSVGNSFELTFNVFLCSIAVLFFPLCRCLGPAQLYRLLGALARWLVGASAGSSVRGLARARVRQLADSEESEDSVAG